MHLHDGRTHAGAALRAHKEHAARQHACCICSKAGPSQCAQSIVLTCSLCGWKARRVMGPPCGARMRVRILMGDPCSSPCAFHSLMFCAASLGLRSSCETWHYLSLWLLLCSVHAVGLPGHWLAPTPTRKIRQRCAVLCGARCAGQPPLSTGVQGVQSAIPLAMREASSAFIWAAFDSRSSPQWSRQR